MCGRYGESGSGDNVGLFGMGSKRQQTYWDTGTAARFFFQADWSYEVAEQLAAADPVRYCAKASGTERNQNLDDFYWRKDKSVPFGFVRIDREEWERLPEKRRARGNVHPTVKPISLLVHLATLLSPPPTYAPRRLLVPFAGSGSEGIGAILSGGWEEITGIELLAENTEIATARCKWWQGWHERTGSAEPKEILKISQRSQMVNSRQLSLLSENEHDYASN